MKRILISGGAGFLGSHLCNLLCKTAAVTVLDNFSNSNATALKGLPVTLKKMECWSAPALRLLETGSFDTVIHLSANAYIPTSVDHPLEDFNTNLVQTVCLLEAVRQMKKKPKVMLFSSAAVLGERQGTMKITDPIRPVSPYGASKAGVEHYGQIYSSTYQLPIQIIRLFPLYGPGQRKQVVFDLMVKLIANTQTLSVIGNGTEVRDLLFVRDAAAMLEKITTKAPFDGSVLQLCSGKGTTIAALTNALIKVSSSAKKIVFTRTLRSGDVSRMVGSLNQLAPYRLKKLTPLSEGLKETWNWFNHTKQTRKTHA